MSGIFKFKDVVRVRDNPIDYVVVGWRGYNRYSSCMQKLLVLSELLVVIPLYNLNEPVIDFSMIPASVVKERERKSYRTESVSDKAEAYGYQS